MARRDRRRRMTNTPSAPTDAIAAKPQPTPMPAAAPPLRPVEELLDGDGDAGVVPPLVGSAPFPDAEPLLPDAPVALDEGELDIDAIPADIVGGRVPAAVSKRSRWREIVWPNVALGLVSQPAFIAFRSNGAQICQCPTLSRRFGGLCLCWAYNCQESLNQNVLANKRRIRPRRLEKQYC